MFKTAINKELHELLKKIKQHRASYVFNEPIEKIIDNYPLYKEVIKKPLDLKIIEKKILEKQYPSAEEFREDINTMLENCRVFNQKLENYIKIADQIQQFFDNNFKKTELKISKLIEKLEQQQKGNSNAVLKGGLTNINSNLNALYMKTNLPSNNKLMPLILGSNEEEKIYEKLYNLFSKITPELGIEENKVEELIATITKSLVKRSKSTETICEETVKFLNTFMNNKEDKESKIKFLKKFRKLIKSIKDDQGDEASKMNIKINLNKDKSVADIKYSKELVENAIKVTQELLDTQKIPECYREIEEFPIE